MEPEPGNAFETEGVLNPAAARGPDGELYLFPRLVARGNYSRIGIARVRFNAEGDPMGVERLGIALEPSAPYELRSDGGGGCEDPRITYLETLGRYLMTYTAYSPRGPRIALALSTDLRDWERLGPATFTPIDGRNFTDINNKDALVFPVAVPSPDGRPAMAMIHRPLYPGTEPQETALQSKPRTIDVNRESMWISYCLLESVGHDPRHLCHFSAHHRLAAPIESWERLKIGGGTPPVLTPDGWLVIYHAVEESSAETAEPRKLRYSAGALVLDEHDPRTIRYRSATPILRPEMAEEREGTVADVVFPTGVDPRGGVPPQIDIYYGMADARIGAARLFIPQLPAEQRAAQPRS